MSFAGVTATMNGNLYHWNTKPAWPWVLGNGYQKAPTIYQSLADWQATGHDSRSVFASSDPLNADYTLKDPSVHKHADRLPADVARLIGQSAGTRHVGCFW